MESYIGVYCSVKVNIDFFILFWKYEIEVAIKRTLVAGKD